MLLISSVSERLAHSPGAKKTRTEVWTACGKRIAVARCLRVRVVGSELHGAWTGQALDRELCECAQKGTPTNV
jgi:hypothetical protein